MHIAHMQTIRRNLIWVGWELAHNSFTTSATNLAIQLCHLQTNKKQSDATLFLQVGVHVSWEVTWFTQNIRNGDSRSSTPCCGNWKIWSPESLVKLELLWFMWNLIFPPKLSKNNIWRQGGTSWPSKTLEPLPSSQSSIQADENDKSMTGHAWQGGSVADQ